MVQPTQDGNGQRLTDGLDRTGIGVSFCNDRCVRVSLEYFCDGPALLNNLPISSRDLRLRLSQVLVEHLSVHGARIPHASEARTPLPGRRCAWLTMEAPPLVRRAPTATSAGALRTSGISTIRRSRMATLCMYSRMRGNGNPRLGGGELAAEQFDQQID
jgi:hypothetical protein